MPNPTPIWYQVVLWNDEDHSYEYVVEMLKELFGYSTREAFGVAQEIDTTGRAVCFLTRHETEAAAWRERILKYGPDQRVARSKTSMRASVEPACRRDPLAT